MISIQYKDNLKKDLQIPIVLSLLLVVISYYDYLLYHTLVELVAIVIGVLLFTIVVLFNVNDKNNVLKTIAIGYFFIALIDLIHTLSYKGMNLIPIAGISANLATQLWIEARFLQALVLLVAIALIDKKITTDKLIKFFGVIFIVITAFVFSGYSPDAYIDGYGLTVYKIGMEYIIVAILLVVLYMFYLKRESLGERTFYLFSISIVLTIFSELAFTFYISVFGISNLVGHIFKLFAFWFIFLEIKNIVKINLHN